MSPAENHTAPGDPVGVAPMTDSPRRPRVQIQAAHPVSLVKARPALPGAEQATRSWPRRL